ncbi:MAG: protease pro-enzyme activation domain-containing protein [Terracidiphilus sp.]|jgi:subtilase family serine protease
MTFRRVFCALSPLTLALALAAVAPAQTSNPFITGPVDNAQRVVLAGNVHPQANAANDRGLLDESAPLPALQIVLQRSPENEAAFENYIAELHNSNSPLFHKWLSNAQIGSMFGPAQSDIDAVNAWLVSEGFTVNFVSPDGTTIEFSGNAGMVSRAFNAPLHNLSANGAAHIGNVNDPSIPAALAPVIAGVAKLNDFMPHALNVPRPATRPNLRNGNGGAGYNFLGAADLATIYNFNPLFKAGITGKGQTIVVVEDTTQYSQNDWLVFRKVMGLTESYPYGTMTQVSPAGRADTCTNPGDNGDDVEAAIDVDWATSAAPDAAIISASCADTNTQFGGFLALANLLTRDNPPAIVSISYGESEPDNGAAENRYIKDLYEVAVAEGVSVFVSSGDELAASSDNDGVAQHGITVSGLTSTPYNISVGGTDIAAEPLGETSTYFSATNIGPYYRTALSYVPEIPWSDSCTSSVTVDFLNTYDGTSFTQAGPGSFCNYDNGAVASDDGLLGAVGGSGGPSNCATGTPATPGVANGACAGYAKPLWQLIIGNPRDGVRDIPDVSLMAGNGLWGVYYAACISNPADGPAAEGFGPCGPNPATWTGWGGTSVSSPIWAGIQALVNQKTRSSWGNSNWVLYLMADFEYGFFGDSSCNSTLGNAIGSKCLFHDVTLGDNSGVCEKDGAATFNCYLDGAQYGILSTSNTTQKEAYPATPGWDFTSGIGTPNAANIVNVWP